MSMENEQYLCAHACVCMDEEFHIPFIVGHILPKGLNEKNKSHIPDTFMHDVLRRQKKNLLVMKEELEFNVILLDSNFRKRLIFGRLHWLRCIGLLLQWVITQIVGVYPERIGKTSSDEPEEGMLWQEQSDRKMKFSARTAEVREKKTLLFSSFILELLQNKLLVEEPFLDCYVTEVTWFRSRTPREEPGGAGVCAGAVSSFDPGALLLPSTKLREPLWFDLSL